MLELSKTAFEAALKDTLEAGKELERQRIVEAIINDAVISTNVQTEWVEYLVGIVENV